MKEDNENKNMQKKHQRLARDPGFRMGPFM